jgi:hypothetical protein
MYVWVEALIIGLPFGTFTGLKQAEGAMNSGGDMSSKTGSIEIKTL